MFDQDARHGSSVKTGADFALEYLDINKVFRPSSVVCRNPAVDGAAGIIGSIPAREPAFPCASRKARTCLSIAVGSALPL